MSAENKPCPFCGVNLVIMVDEDGAFYEHGIETNGPCIIGTLCVEIDMLDLWNRRADTMEREPVSAGGPDGPLAVQRPTPQIAVLDDHADRASAAASSTSQLAIEQVVDFAKSVPAKPGYVAFRNYLFYLNGLAQQQA